jgi:alkylglycerol monooxygenase
MNVGVAERLIDLFTAGAFYYFYAYLYEHFALFDIEEGVLLWIALILATDFVWYWYHRMGHEINLFWGFHVVHHTSEEFNYTAGTRITIFQAVLRTGCWAVLPIIGFPPGMITTMLIIHGLYPFFTHTQLIGKLGILEYVLVTPSHHRVHHASNEKYLDKNYGDMFIIWDKLFGTFAQEEEGRAAIRADEAGGQQQLFVAAFSLPRRAWLCCESPEWFFEQGEGHFWKPF